jgi:hypothetical protein
MKTFSVFAIALSAAMLAACGNVTPEDLKLSDAKQLLDTAKVTELLPPETKSVVTSYTRDLRNAAEAYKAEFGQFPKSFADIASVAGARETAVNLIADGLGEQVPFASRATLEKAANGVVTTAERQILERMRTQDAPNQ